MRAVLALLLLTMISISGCTSDAGTDGKETGAEGEPEDLESIELPEWQVGDWWTYSNSFGDDFTLVVTEDNGATWSMDTENVDLAFVHSAFAEISYLGDIRKEDLAGSQGGAPVQWLDFPLTHNKEWQAQWDGKTFDMVAHVTGDTAHIIASIDGTQVNTLVYDAREGWFRSIRFGDPETGEEYGRMDLKASGTGYTDELVRVHAVLVAEDSYGGPSQKSVGLLDASTASDDADAYLVYDVACEAGSFQFSIATNEAATADVEGEDPQGHILTTPCPYTTSYAGVIGHAPGNGDQWSHAFHSESLDLTLSFQLYWRNFERISI